MRLAVDHPQSGPARNFSPVAALVLGFLVAVAGMVAAAITSAFIAGSVDPMGPGAFLDEIAGGRMRKEALTTQRFEGLVLFLTAPITIAMILGLASMRGDPRRLLAIGGTFPKRPLLIAAAFVAVTVIFETWLASVFPHLRELFTLPTEGTALVLAVIGAVIGAPIAEELLFRGMIYTAVRERWGYGWALVLTSVVFGGMHVEPTGVYMLLVLPSGFLLGWLREKSGGIYAPVLVHATFNAIACAGLLIERA